MTGPFAFTSRRPVTKVIIFSILDLLIIDRVVRAIMGTTEQQLVAVHAQPFRKILWARSLLAIWLVETAGVWADAIISCRCYADERVHIARNCEICTRSQSITDFTNATGDSKTFNTHSFTTIALNQYTNNLSLNYYAFNQGRKAPIVHNDVILLMKVCFKLKFETFLINLYFNFIHTGCRESGFIFQLQSSIILLDYGVWCAVSQHKIQNKQFKGTTSAIVQKSGTWISYVQIWFILL